MREYILQTCLRPCTYLALAVDADVGFVRVALGSVYHFAHSLRVEIVALCHANERTRFLLL